LSFEFGIMLIDTDKNEITETYHLGNSIGNISVKSCLTNYNKIVAATNNGLFYGNLNDNLLDFTNWKKIPQFSNKEIKNTLKVKERVYVVIEDSNEIDNIYELNANLQLNKIDTLSGTKNIKISTSNEKIIIIREDNNLSVYNSDIDLINSFNIYGSGLQDIASTEENIYVINNAVPLIEYKLDGTTAKNIQPIGPVNNDVFDITVTDGVVWTINGAYDFSINNAFKYIHLNLYENGKWTNYNNFNTSSLNDVYDPISVETHPNNPKNVFVSTWGNGLFEMNENPPFLRYDENNSTIEKRQALNNWRGVSDVTFDEEGILWGVNTHVPYAIFCRTIDNNWISFDMGTGADQIVHENRLTEIVITPGGIKWVAMPLANKILAFDNNGTIQNKNDDRHLIVSQEQGGGNLPG
ncbi:MAG: hypothetical protein WD512_05785, partial [Candidatus Paceibacterota bacterium]